MSMLLSVLIHKMLIVLFLLFLLPRVMFGGPDPRLCTEAPDPGQRSEVGAGPMSLTDLTPFAGHIVSWGGAQPVFTKP